MASIEEIQLAWCLLSHTENSQLYWVSFVSRIHFSKITIFSHVRMPLKTETMGITVLGHTCTILGWEVSRATLVDLQTCEQEKKCLVLYTTEFWGGLLYSIYMCQ